MLNVFAQPHSVYKSKIFHSIIWYIVTLGKSWSGKTFAREHLEPVSVRRTCNIFKHWQRHLLTWICHITYPLYIDVRIPRGPKKSGGVRQQIIYGMLVHRWLYLKTIAYQTYHYLRTEVQTTVTMAKKPYCLTYHRSVIISHTERIKVDNLICWLGMDYHQECEKFHIVKALASIKW